jgi:uncharacterized coiled-coil protein SlyX
VVPDSGGIASLKGRPDSSPREELDPTRCRHKHYCSSNRALFVGCWRCTAHRPANNNADANTANGMMALFKHDIKPMDKASEVILALKPVTYKYNGDKKGTTQYGVIAEEVAEVAPDLVFRDKNGDVQTVRFEQIGAMLLNEFLKEHSTVEQLKSTVAKQEAIIAQQQKGMEALTAQLKDQAAQIQKVSARLEASRPAPQVVLSTP